MKIAKYDIKTDTFKYKKVKYIDDRFGVYLISGKQGSNKTYYAVYLATLQSEFKVNKIKTNIHSLCIPGYYIEYFEKITEIYKDVEQDCIFIIDEISRKYHKNSPCDKDFYAWLNQCRKRNRIAILITQEYLELPMWLRRPCKFYLNNSTIPILTKIFGLYRCTVGNGYNLVYNKEENEYECPTVQINIYKRNEYIASLYDTFEPINDL